MSTHADQITRAVAEGRAELAELAETLGTLARKVELGARLHDATEMAGGIKTKAGDLSGRAAEGMARLGEKVPDVIRSTPPVKRGFLARHRIPVIGVAVVVAVAAALRLRSRRVDDRSNETHEAAPGSMTSDRPSTHQSA
ncbi:MAG TPA: hypothetical protein VFH50_03615 [Acidimicrobiales bacterium]|nr:hypothetical protein [Acidimicrobiales bacterium]